uniref:Uncharacterized protein n=1 Tax=Chlamydomonas leiostraca TaxID=1034604 RepID=A0A7S0WUE0_9CHLO
MSLRPEGASTTTHTVVIAQGGVGGHMREQFRAVASSDSFPSPAIPLRPGRAPALLAPAPKPAASPQQQGPVLVHFRQPRLYHLQLLLQCWVLLPLNEQQQ